MPETIQDILRRILDAINGEATPSALDVNGIPKAIDTLLAEIAAALVSGTFAGPQSLAILTDVDITDLQDGDVLTYNAETGKWENKAPETPAAVETVG
jgi:hypothetical protein